jgi:hypothetical protein
MEREPTNNRQQNELTDQHARRRDSHAARRCGGDVVTRGIMMSFARACLAASAVLCFASDHAAAQYNVFDTRNGTLTDVYVNDQPMRLDHVQQFEERCQTSIAAGRWWVDPNTGNLDPVGGPALYNINTCQSLGPQKKSEDKCTFFAGGGSICSGRDWGTVN